MPRDLRLESDLGEHRNSPTTRDFIASSRLNFLHVHFLLKFVETNGTQEADFSLCTTAFEMLGLVMDVITQRDSLANSGTGLMWKVSCACSP